MSEPIDLGSETGIVAFRLNGKTFECFPIDEIDSINDAASKLDPPIKEGEGGERFLEMIQKRLKSKHGIDASLAKSIDWYNALHLANERQKDFFAESPVSSDSTDSFRGVETGETPVIAEIPTGIINPEVATSGKKSARSRNAKSGSSKPSKTRSTQKK